MAKDPDDSKVPARDSGAGPEGVAAYAPTMVASPSSYPPPEAQRGEFGPGDTIGRYRLVELIGRGGMGMVYRAHDPDLQRDVALKVLPPAPQSSSALRDLHARLLQVAQQRLLREARAIAKLNHTNVITVYETSTGDHRGFIAMELAEGGNLADWLGAAAAESSREQGSDDPASQESDGGAGREEPRPVHPWREVLARFIQAGRGLAAAHQAGIVHRDFKPANVLFGGDGRVLVTDFGLAHLMNESALDDADEPDQGSDATGATSGAGHGVATDLDNGREDLKLTQTGMVIGTPAYMAPEQHLDQELDVRTDQFSFCVALFEALYGQRPFAGFSLDEMRHELLHNNMRQPARDSKVPGVVYRIVQRGLAREPDERFPSMEALIGQLERARRPALRRHLGAVVAAGVLAVAVGVTAVVVLASRPGDAVRPAPPADPGARVVAPAPPADPALAAAVAGLRRDLADVEASTFSSDVAAIRSRARGLVERARTLDYRPVEAEALALLGKILLVQEDESEEVLATLREAALIAEEASHPVLLAEALVLQADALVRYTADRQAIDAAQRRASAAVAHHGGESAKARLEQVRGRDLGSQGERRAALERLESARRQYVVAGEAVAAAEVMLEQAALQLEMGDGDLGVGRCRRALDIVEGELGEDNLYTTMALQQMAVHYILLGRSEDARALQSRLEAFWNSDAGRRVRASEAAGEPGEGRRRIQGRVLDPTGQPVSGAEVLAGRYLVGGSKYLMLSKIWDQVPWREVRTAVSNASGEFALDTDLQKDLVILAEAASGRSFPVVVDGGGEVQGLVVRLRPYGRVRGAIENRDSREGLHLIAVYPRGGRFGEQAAIFARVGPEGRFGFERLAAGEYDVSLGQIGWSGLRQRRLRTVRVKAEQDMELTLRLPDEDAAKVTLTVLVRGRLRSPVVSAQVLLVEGELRSGVAREVLAHVESDHRSYWLEAGRPVSEFGATGIDLDGARQGDSIVSFESVGVGEFSLCAQGFSVDADRDPEFAHWRERNELDLMVTCKPVRVAASPARQSVMIEIEPLSPPD